MEFSGFVEAEHVVVGSEDVGDGGAVRCAELSGFPCECVEFHEEPGAQATPDVPTFLHPVTQRPEGNTRHFHLLPALARQSLWIPRDDRYGITERQIVNFYDMRRKH